MLRGLSPHFCNHAPQLDPTPNMSLDLPLHIPPLTASYFVDEVLVLSLKDGHEFVPSYCHSLGAGVCPGQTAARAPRALTLAHPLLHGVSLP